ncbi:general transcription factor IIE subunit 1-like [Acanthaster planci]|uniref:General transcription factor IIE subunit 1 n=1 Tax=Acanthaster planci TaxID=133434 RepID=A0A8B7XMP8_ACAPL|nr:general transcription factor IIE subunit 1-like [Acanthaster planci]XP_022082095.1 general transcription factor IIE subunit 1-like [Acanthaster planci]
MNPSVLSSVTEPSVLTEVPNELKRLARYITRGFYTIEHALIVDILVRNPIVKEDDMADLLKFDKKQLRIFINRLKNDKLIKQTMRVETQPDGRTNRHNYYFINYKVFVDVVKYKLDRMRQKIESKERDSTCKALFKCPQCHKEYNEFDAGNLIDVLTGQLHCTFCGTEVQEDESAVPEKDTYMQIALFNEQMKPIFDLLKSVEHIQLSKTLLEPTPSAANENKKPSAGRSGSASGSGPHSTWSGDSSRNLGFEMYDQQITINVGEETKREQAAKAPARERPVWLVESTVEGAVAETPSGAAQNRSPVGAGPSARPSTKNKESEEIIRALLAHERKSGTGAVVPGEDNSDAESDASGSDDDFPGASTSAPITHTVEMDSGEEDEDEDEEDVMVSVAGRMVPFQDITDELVAQMTPSEKEAYIKIGQEAYAAMYE